MLRSLLSRSFWRGWWQRQFQSARAAMKSHPALVTHARRILLGSSLGVATALLCPQLPEKLQFPCRLALSLANAWVSK